MWGIFINGLFCSTYHPANYATLMEYLPFSSANYEVFVKAEEIERELRPYLGEESGPEGLFAQLEAYLTLLVKWNARTNLTAIREPAEMVRRHFGESLFAARQLGGASLGQGTLLDFGSGAGFPGLPVQLWWPKLEVTLAESQNKKATFLREVVRTLGLKTEVWAARVETMPSARLFDVVAMRAVDDMGVAVPAAMERVGAGGRLMMLTTGRMAGDCPVEFSVEGEISIPGAADQVVRVMRRG